MARTSIAGFRATVWEFWKENGRHNLPWRKTKDPYKILVSEVMLQQTQVARVIGKYKEFLEGFSTAEKLARAPLGKVLKIWSGLGYNRRAKYLHDAVKEVVGTHDGHFAKALQHQLPGVGPYTKAAVRVFAFNEPDVLIETNIRAVYIHHFYSSVLQKTAIADSDIRSFAAKAAKGQDPRTWHWALMDYGSFLKKSGIRNSSRSAHYTKQSKFEGSLRQVRGEVLRQLMKGKNGRNGKKWEKALTSLARDGLIVKAGDRWKIA